MSTDDKTRPSHGVAYLLGASGAIFGVWTGIDPLLWCLVMAVTGLMIVAGGFRARLLRAEQELAEIDTPEFAEKIVGIVERARVIREKRGGAA